MNKKFVLFIILTLVLSFAACGKEETSSFEIAESEEEYTKEAKSFTLPEETEGLWFCIDDNCNFIYDMKNADTEERGTIGLFKAGDKIPCTLFMTEEHLMAYCIGDGYVNACTYNEDSYLVVKMNADSFGEKSHKEFDDALFNNEYPLKMCEIKEEKYVFVTPSAVVICDEEGGNSTKVKCKEKEFVNCLALKNGNFVTISKGEDMRSYLTVYDTDGKQINEKAVFDSNIEYFCEADGKVLLTDCGMVYSWDMNSGKTEKILSLTEEGLSRERVRGISYCDEKVVVLSAILDDGNKRGLLYFFSPGEGIERASKHTIKIYCVGGEMNPAINPTLIEDFELENPQYDVEYVKPNGYVDDLYLVNNHPDILVEMFSSNIDKYASNGYLEDLWPYIDNSDVISREDLVESNTKVFEENGCLYALPLYMTTSGIWIKSSQDDYKGSWNVEEYLEWLEKHPELRSFLPMTKERVLEHCLKASLQDFVDYEKGETFFDSKEFCEILKRVSEISFESEESFDYFVNLAECKDVTYLSDGYVNSVESKALERTCFGEELIYLGFPNRSGGTYINECTTNMGIFSSSENKEAAYDFLEYWLTYSLSKIEKAEVTGGIFWTYKKTLEKDFEKAFEEREMNGLSFSSSEKDYEVLRTAINSGRKLTVSELEILDIIKEEFESMEANGKSPEETARVIQSRINILINEKK